MAKGAKRKTKWVSLSLDGANTTTSSGVPGSDGEQPLPHVHRHKAHHSSSSIQQKQNERKDPAAEAVPEHSSSIKATEQDHQNGNRTDTSGSGSDSAVAGSERRYPTSYHKRKPPPYSAERRTNSSWGGGGHYAGSNRSHYGGYYGTGRRSYYGEARRGHQSVVGTTGSKTTTTSDSGGATNTINDDEYTRITTPRQDVLFKKGYLSRPKPQTTTTTTTTMTAASGSNENTTASSSLAGTTSEGSDGGNGGGSNSISTTESITSDYGGSFAADSFPIPCLPYGYFTENGVLVMNGFAVDNNGYSYFNGGQTYIYPPNFTNCQAPNSAEASVPEEVGELASSSGGAIYDGTVALAEEQLDDAQATAYEEKGTTECTAVPDVVMSMPDSSTMPGVMTIEEGSSDQPEASVTDGFLVSQTNGATITDDGSFEGSDLEANGFYQFNDSYDMAQFYSSVYYPQWCMGQYGLCEDGTPLQATEYVMPNGEVYTHQTSFKKRKKRFRHHDEVQQDESGTALESVAAPVPLMYTTVPVQEGFVPSSTTTTVPAQLNHQLNADVQEFLPSTVTPGSATTDVTERTTSHRSARKSNTQPTAAKKSNSTVSSASKNVSSAKAAVATKPVEPVATPSVKPVPNNLRPPLGSQKNRKKDLIESTLAFAEQNIDLTRPKLAASHSHDSDLLWTTVSKGGRKRVVEQEQPVESPITASSVRQVDEAKPVIDSQQSSIKQPEPVVVSSSETRPPATVVDIPEAESKKEVTGKNKKKTQKHKRQQRKPGNAVMHRQPLEGFQLIEPEFTSKPGSVSQRGGKGCDSEVQNLSEPDEEAIDPMGYKEVVEETLEIEEAGREGELVVGAPSVEENKVVVCITEEAEKEKEERKEEKEVPHDELICDRIVEHVDSAPTVGCIAVECSEAAEPVPESRIVVEQAIILNETETEKQVMLEVATMANTAGESECYEPGESKTEECLSIVPAAEKESTATIMEETAIAKEEPNQPSVEISSLAVEEPQMIECVTIKPLLTIAAEPVRVPDERTPRMSDSDEADEEDMSEDRHRKRDSVSGYTESIDSGLQSPAPCGQATPETSSLASSHEAEPHEDEHREQQLSQLVGLWLARKLEDHEPDEVFVLPHSNPLLMQRLHQFQQLQCGRVRLASDSYDEDDDDGDDDEQDTDSDYMSDGQGRHDGNVATNPNSPVIKHVSEDPSTGLAEQAQQQQQPEQHQLQNGTKSLNLHLKQSEAVLNGSTKTTASSTISEQTQQKRCVIM
ncbi:serine-rich adhesin for platelets-like [Anopheles albimanus]|uniref:serine-rich adhesin for platelets-like n=1 Tax=Anopheles albimanus TaxID=7167 RepID=UPI00163E748E|nr:serine-rich adhesin for platelets-like [Anopheles albimanus]XP_035786459.1 serine-rich adhesin for platelets-like [Anopheles albimanus]XP_035786460.1 serine-rich adhesin for platelets-like [Anopheles albimanus]XP_035786462.1 serine-rich adhesin for platelets-like [Anopheles albimanus]XP_035786463.1 serine-rich adhesin for platelets-like [Anopheles albimanus]XP_035786464.1 serine-rich adhesin for platelets-like [Anopheles albimanus]XP_035786465.1 serine-rich adhesin for platelets-like [Anop